MRYFWGVYYLLLLSNSKKALLRPQLKAVKQWMIAKEKILDSFME